MKSDDRVDLKIYPSYICNMSCDYCEESHDFTMLPSSTLEQILRDYGDRLSNTVHLVGGEPSVYLKKVDYCEILKKYFDNIKITTNLQSDYIIDVCDRYNATLVVSWNGVLDQNNKHINGEELLSRIRRYKKYVELITIVVDDTNVTDLYQLANFCYNECIKWEVIPRFSTKENVKVINQAKLEFILRDLVASERISFCTQWIELLKNGKLTHCVDCMKTSRCIIPNGEIYSCPISSPIFSKESSTWNTLPCEFKGFTSESKQNYDKFICGITNVFNSCDIDRSSLLFSKRLLLMMSDGCNMNCEYCFETNSHGRYKTSNIMTKDTLKNVIRYIITHDTSTVIRLFGGEPTMNLEGIRFLRQELENNVVLRRLVEDLIMTSNMYNISDEMICEINKLSNICEFKITMSLDTPPDVDNRRLDISGCQSGNAVVTNLLRLREYSKKVHINVHFVVSRITYKYFDKMVEWLQNLYCGGVINEYEFGLMDPDRNTPQSLLTLDELKYISDYYWSNIVDNQDIYPNEFIQAFKLFRFDLTSDYNILNKNSFFVCQSGIEDMAVDSYGYFIQCQRSTHMNSSNDYSSNNNINNTLYVRKKYKDRDVNKFSCNNRKCLECRTRLFCVICPAFNHNVTGDLFQQSQESCDRAHCLLELYNEKKREHMNKIINRKMAIQSSMLQTILGYMIEMIEGVTK